MSDVTDPQSSPFSDPPKIKILSPPSQKELEEQARKRREQLDLVKKTHEIFVGISGADLDLRGGDPPGHTDCETFISVPFEDPEVGLIHKHEWQHKLMGSDLKARSLFCKEYAEQIMNQVLVPGMDRGTLENFLHLFVNGVDDLRVNDLWKRPYPQSSEDIAERWRRIILSSDAYRTDIILYTMAVGLGLKDQSPIVRPMMSSQWDKYEKTIRLALSKVWGNGGVAPMIAVRIIVDSMLDELAKKFSGEVQVINPPPNLMMPPMQLLPPDALVAPARGLGRPRTHARPQAGQGSEQNMEDQKQTMQTAQAGLLGKLINGISKEEQKSGFSDTEWGSGLDPDPNRTRQVVDSALRTPDSLLNKVLQDSKAEVDRVIQTLLTQVKTRTKDERLLMGYEEKVGFRDVRPEEVQEMPLGPFELDIISTLRKKFARLADRKKRALGESGGEIDPTAYVDFLVGSNEGEIFVDEQRQGGFSALILLDMSGSMKEDWAEVAHACKVLAKSMKNPNVRVEVWGFSGHRNSATIFRFKNVERGYDVLDHRAWGSTPMVPALDVALRHLKTMPGSAHHLFLLTDGMPNSLEGRSEPLTSLVRTVSDLIKRARGQGINVATLLVGPGIPAAYARVMFGDKEKWAQVPENGSIFVALVSLVGSAFAQYLRKK